MARASGASTCWLFAAVIATVCMGQAAPARCDPITLNGITFSDELGGFVLIDGWGTGTLADPFVVVERITGDGAAVLTVRGLSRGFGNPVRSNHFVGFALTKVVINATRRPWLSFGVGLQSQLGEDSTYLDGLSFGQDDAAVRPLDSDHYDDVSVIDEPYDGITFSGGVVAPGGQAVFRLIITDNSPRPEFYLVQRRPEPIARTPAAPRARGSAAVGLSVRLPASGTEAAGPVDRGHAQLAARPREARRLQIGRAVMGRPDKAQRPGRRQPAARAAASVQNHCSPRAASTAARS